MNEAAQIILHAAHPLEGAYADLDPVVERCRGARVVLLGEATHGTHEFYETRSEVTRRLITDLGFHAIAAESDWPDSWRVNRYVKGDGEDTTAEEALEGFRRFPQWMWRNSDMLDFVGWLRDFNDSKGTSESKIGFHGIDLYSLNDSMHAVIDYLRGIDPPAARDFSRRYACFDHFDGDVMRYGLLTGTGISKGCEEEAVGALAELRRRRGSYLSLDGHTAEDAYFSAEQNARVVAHAENYYRIMMRGDVSSWNLRDRHMMDTLVALMAHLDRIHGEARIVVWAHNSHVGNADATEMGRRGEFNIGQLAREHFGAKAVSIGFTTFSGTVTAASDWDAPAEHKRVRPALAHSCERLFHETETPRFWLDFSRNQEAAKLLEHPLLQRAIGVVYRPDTERQSHYFMSRVSAQFDAVFHFDETRAVEPLEKSAIWEKGEIDETYPSGL